MKKNYYAVYGSNAVIVLSNYEKACQVRDRYMKPPKNIKGFTIADDALGFAVDHLNSIAGTYRVVPKHLDMYKFYSVRELPFLDKKE